MSGHQSPGGTTPSRVNQKGCLSSLWRKPRSRWIPATLWILATGFSVLGNYILGTESGRGGTHESECTG